MWALIAVIVAIEVLTEWAQATPSPGVLMVQPLFGYMRALAQAFLIVLVIQEEALPGDKQYWLTRPYMWRSLLLAKAVFVVSFVSLPVLLVDAGALVSRGQSPLVYLPSLVIAQTFTLVKFGFVIALATITRSLAQFATTSLAAYVCLFGAGILTGTLFRSGVPEWGGLEWIRTTVVALLGFMIVLAVVLIQYRRRDTQLARRFAAVGVLGLLLSLFWMPGWHVAFGILGRLTVQTWAASHVRIQTDHRDGSTLLAGVPGGMSLYSDPAPMSRNSGVLSNAGTNGPYARDNRLLPGDGSYSIYSIDAFRGPTTIPVTLLSTPTATPMGLRSEPWAVPGWGLVPRMDSNRRHPFRSMLLARTWPALVSFRIHWLDTGDTNEMTPWPTTGLAFVDYAPYPTGGFWPAVQIQMNLNNRPFEIALLSRYVVAHFERVLETSTAGGQPTP